MRNRYGVAFAPVLDKRRCEAEVRHGQGKERSWFEQCQKPARWHTTSSNPHYVCAQHMQRIMPEGFIVVRKVS